MFKTLLVLFIITFFTLNAYQSNTTYTYKTVGSLNLLADVFVPETAPSQNGKYPVLFFVHGGGYVGGSKTSGAYSDQELNEALSRGWVSVSIDYRLAPGALLSDIVQDVQDAYVWIRNTLPQTVPVDPDCITIFGFSAGGGLSVISGYMLKPRPKAVIAFYPGFANFTDATIYDGEVPDQALVSEANDLRQLIGEYTPQTLNTSRVALFIDSFIQHKLGWLLATQDPNTPASEVLQILTNYSAVYNIDPQYPPTYLAHGIEDVVVPYHQSVEMATVLQAHGVDYKLYLVPDAGHNFDQNCSSQIWQMYVKPAFDFAQHYMGGEATDECVKVIP